MQTLWEVGDEFLEMIKGRVTIWLSNSTPRCIPQRTENIQPPKILYADIYSIAIHNSPKLKTTQMSISYWMDKWNVVYPRREYYLTIWRYKVLLQAITCINLENITLNEHSWSKLLYDIWSYLYKMSRVGKPVER